MALMPDNASDLIMSPVFFLSMRLSCRRLLGVTNLSVPPELTCDPLILPAVGRPWLRS